MQEKLPTEILKEEHEIIKRMLNILEVASKKIEKTPLTFFQRAVDFIKNFADKCHHGKEEKNLFPVLEKLGIPREGGPIGVMLEEHDIGRNFVKGIVDGINRNDKKIIVENSLGYVQLLRDHIDKENNILYPMGDNLLAENDNKQLMEKFEDVERWMGEGIHGKYVKLVEELEKELKIKS